ncbi:hypothetical protein [Klebsiella variicola]|uniref:hypothetical protein n=1 Tax=Klebsiella variicola TaxID=244366 RepID=UPI00103350D2|nr:hypothetical protein [Klebsiella variicola]
MTDITELAQSLKAAAIDAKELAIIARYSKGRAAAEKFYALANPNNVIALVEALEKAQQRISQLESRTVKLPQRYDLIGETDGNCSLNDAEMAPDNDGVYLRVRDVREMLTTAGIKVEAE